MCFNGISEVDVVLAAFINDLSKLTEGIITEMKSFSNSSKVIHWWWIWKAVLEREHQTVKVLGHGCKNFVDLKDHFHCV